MNFAGSTLLNDSSIPGGGEVDGGRRGVDRIRREGEGREAGEVYQSLVHLFSY